MQGNAKSFLKAVLLGFGLALLALGTALAMTPAWTQIQNQASASYIDSAGQPRTTTSNLVVTVVQQVYSFTITPNGTESDPGQIKAALPGVQVIFNYLVTNTGNGTDTINLSTARGTTGFPLGSPTIYLDANCNGNLDSGEPAVTSVTLGMGQQACVIVTATIPAGTPSGQRGNLNLVGTSAGGPTDNDNWAQALASNQAALTASKSASPTGPVAPNGTITYTISGQNVGGSAAYGYPVTVDNTPRNGILIEDIIPAGLTVTQVSGFAGAGTVRFIYYDGTAWSTLGTTSPVTGLNILGDGAKKVGMLIEGTGDFFPVGAGYTFSFQAQVPASAPAGTGYPNSATVTFDANGDGDADDTGETVTTNTTTNTVAAAYNVAVGPYRHPDGDGTDSYTVGGYTVTRSGDEQTIASVNSGTTVIFRHTLKNTGNAADSFTLSFSGAPTGWACSLVADDLTTPISGPVGPVAANGGTLDFALKCQVPAAYTSSTPVSLTVRATSVGDPSRSDTTTDKVDQALLGYTVNLTDPGLPPQSADPGQVVYFPIVINNGGASADVYNLTASVPPGWTVVFYPDANCDGTMDSPTPDPVTNTGLVNPGETKCFIAAVQVPAGAAPGDYTVSFTATSTTVPTGSDTISARVNVNFAAQVTLEPDRFGTVASPGLIQYTHILTNNSDTSATCSISGDGGSYGWTYLYSLDGSDWRASLSGVSVAANGGSRTIFVRVLVPAGEPIGRTDVNIVTANCTLGTFTATVTATETTTVAGGELRVTKSAKTYQSDGTTVRDANGATAFPGDVIEYTVEAENVGFGDFTNVKISDPIPAYTTFVSVAATSSFGGTVEFSADGTTWYTNPSDLPASGVGVVYVRVNTMPPGGKITITLRVRVQ